MAHARKSLKDTEIRTILAVFKALQEKPYTELNTFLGSITIEEMLDLKKKLNDWYQPNVNGKIWDEDLGWIDHNTDYR